ncbi:MAG: hypothetical protein K2Q18_07375, partial [Bdellovibrionales bacterium]|nr:hypothetical protein [Bdellovibrionales bacterium]
HLRHINGEGKKHEVSRSTPKKIVTPIQAPAKIKTQQKPQNVLPMKKPDELVNSKLSTEAVKSNTRPLMKKASGGDLSLPSHDHPGFEDV